LSQDPPTAKTFSMLQVRTSIFTHSGWPKQRSNSKPQWCAWRPAQAVKLSVGNFTSSAKIDLFMVYLRCETSVEVRQMHRFGRNVPQWFSYTIQHRLC